MSYQEAMEAAGAEVVAFEQFGSYQGAWRAKVRYKGETGWVQGSYGSCSGCDAFEAEFGWYEDACDEHHRHQTDCAACQEAAASYRQRLAEFGRTRSRAAGGAAHVRFRDHQPERPPGPLGNHPRPTHGRGDRRSGHGPLQPPQQETPV